MYAASIIAQYVIWRESKHGRSVTNLRLQKLLYFIQAQVLVALTIPCFLDIIEAWSFGPVVPNIYHKYKIFGSSAIPVEEIDPTQIEQRVRNEIDKMLETCSQVSTSQLVEVTHNQDPWKNAYRKFNDRITNEAIRSYYAS